MRAVPAASEVPHAVDIDGTRVALTLRRSTRRSFALQVDHRGARVAVPFRATLADIDRFVRHHGSWLLDRLRAHAAAAPAVFRVEDGARLPLLGRDLCVRLGNGRRVLWRDGQEDAGEILLPASGDPRRELIRALKARALTWHRNRVEEYCLRLALPVPAVRLSSARTRWGSCSSASGIRLHWRLIHLPPALIDYVVAHEVAHLVEMNHSSRFWAVVECIYPDWRRARQALRAASAHLPVLDGQVAVDVEE
ncbi:MAG: M48 family metallopeptidase [Proteobacteria bacterium]|uniref:M48 family metallopeptidase n=1 Tax=Thauera sp. 2A1 TaxID=2570191 RepID=UPI001290A653|nr:SprT family zinc-dependent metalloprotease [Thauera sp. 2A1]KAI5913570.1 M48 family metallopeptidase [Thauera sp. 2A1]MBS0543784.1 M48 family metallopeptidase [Pseudomonadota bacterium]